MNYWFLHSLLICSLTHRLKLHQSWGLIAHPPCRPTTVARDKRGEWKQGKIDFIRNESWLWFSPTLGLIVKEELCFVLNKPGEFSLTAEELISHSCFLMPPPTAPYCVFCHLMSDLPLKKSLVFTGLQIKRSSKATLLMCLSLQRSSGPRYLSGLGHDRGDHLLLHLYDVRVTLHQDHARSHAAGEKRLYLICGAQRSGGQTWNLTKHWCTVALCSRSGSTSLWSSWASSSSWRSWPTGFSSPRRLSSGTLEESWIYSSILWVFKGVFFQTFLHLFIFFSCIGQSGCCSPSQLPRGKQLKSLCSSQGRTEIQTVIHTCLTCMSWAVGGSWRTWRDPNKKVQGPSGSDQQLLCCEVTVVTTARPL